MSGSGLCEERGGKVTENETSWVDKEGDCKQLIGSKLEADPMSEREGSRATEGGAVDAC